MTAFVPPGAAVLAPRPHPYRLAQVANYMSPTSGGLGAVVRAIGGHHLRSGGSRLLLLPARRGSVVDVGRDRRVHVAAPPLPGSSGGYRMVLSRRPVRRALDAFAPDLIQIHDQTTLAWVGRWARRRGIPSVLYAHEQMPLIAAEVAGFTPESWRRVVVGAWCRGMVAATDAVICASDFVARTFEDLGATTVHRIPFGVDLETFQPLPRQEDTGPWRPGTVRLVHVARLYPEKHPEIVLDGLAALLARGVPAELVVVGTGPLESMIRERAARERLPVHVLGHLGDQSRLAEVTAAADVALSLGSRETFGLAVLEAMACGTPVVVSDTGASRELLSPGAGLPARTGQDVAEAVLRLVGDPLSGALARHRAEAFSWAAATARIRDVELELLERSGRHLGAGRSAPLRVRPRRVTAGARGRG